VLNGPLVFEDESNKAREETRRLMRRALAEVFLLRTAGAIWQIA
jgi:hypothetical protein